MWFTLDSSVLLTSKSQFCSTQTFNYLSILILTLNGSLESLNEIKGNMPTKCTLFYLSLVYTSFLKKIIAHFSVFAWIGLEAQWGLFTV